MKYKLILKVPVFLFDVRKIFEYQENSKLNHAFIALKMGEIHF